MLRMLLCRNTKLFTFDERRFNVLYKAANVIELQTIFVNFKPNVETQNAENLFSGEPENENPFHRVYFEH